MNDDMMRDLVDELRATHGAHTIILYGSRARGDATAESDIDVAAYSDVELTSRDARLWDGMFLDAFVYPTVALAAPADLETMKLLGGQILLDERGLATALLDRIAAFFAAGPAPLTADDAQMRRVWAKKMLARVERGDVEAHYRHHWLLFQLLEDYFALRNAWYLGPKRAFADLDPVPSALFAAALAPGAPHDALAALVEHVAGT